MAIRSRLKHNFLKKTIKKKTSKNQKSKTRACQFVFSRQRLARVARLGRGCYFTVSLTSLLSSSERLGTNPRGLANSQRNRNQYTKPEIWGRDLDVACGATTGNGFEYIIYIKHPRLRVGCGVRLKFTSHDHTTPTSPGTSHRRQLPHCGGVMHLTSWGSSRVCRLPSRAPGLFR